MSEWKDCTIADLVAINRATYSPKEGWPFVNYLDTGSVTENNIEQIQHLDVKTDKVPSRARRKAVPGSIVYSTVRPNQRHYALIKSVPENFLVSTGFAVLDVKPGVADERFVFSYLTQQTVIDKLQSIAEQGVCTYPALNPDDIGALTVCIPDLPIQRKIAAVLGALDDKIELNRKMNANLEAMAQSLFKSWFVDFEPFGGTKPEGWREGTLGEIVKVMETGSRPKGGALQNGIPSIGAENVEGLGLYNYASDKYVSQDFFDRLKRGKVASGDVLLYKDGAYTGKTSMALDGFPHKVAAVNEHVFILRTEECKYQSYLYCLLKHSDMYKAINTLASSKAAQPGLNQTELSSVEIVVPAEDMIAAFEGIVSPLLHKMAANANQSRTLAQLRDTLLPKLMSGELNVDDVKID